MNDTIFKRPSITVWLDDSNDNVLKAFRCCVCGKIVFEYYSSVKMIVPGRCKLNSPQVIQCSGIIYLDSKGTIVSIQEAKEAPERYIRTRCKTKYYVE